MPGTVERRASKTDLWRGKDFRGLSAKVVEESAQIIQLAESATITLNWKAGFNFSLTLTDDRTLAVPTGGVPGTSRLLIVTNTLSESPTLTMTGLYAASSTGPTLTAGGTDYLIIFCETVSKFMIKSLVSDVSVIS